MTPDNHINPLTLCHCGHPLSMHHPQDVPHCGGFCACYCYQPAAKPDETAASAPTAGRAPQTATLAPERRAGIDAAARRAVAQVAAGVRGADLPWWAAQAAFLAHAAVDLLAALDAERRRADEATRLIADRNQVAQMWFEHAQRAAEALPDDLKPVAGSDLATSVAALVERASRLRAALATLTRQHAETPAFLRDIALRASIGDRDAAHLCTLADTLESLTAEARATHAD